MATNEPRKRILVVDDEQNVRESLKLILSRVYEVETAENANLALEILSSAGRTLPDLVLVDVIMPGLDGLGLLERVKTSFPEMPVIMLTASKTVKTAVQAMKFGAVDYLNKPFDVEELMKLIEGTLSEDSNYRLGGPFLPRPDLPNLPGDFGCIVGKHPVMLEVYKKIEQLADRETTILITGESGTGKELVAKEIHDRSRRGKGPFVAINCSAIPESLIESELFGHEKGAFTHAVEKRIGYFELAHGGTLFLDEIGELSLPIQVKLLRFLQDHQFYRIGRSKPIRVDVRVLAATNRSLETAVKEGKMRQDLYYRINVVNIDLPPLRERADDIDSLVQYFLTRFAPMYGGRSTTIGSDALTILRKYSWPGNVRELENAVESILALTSSAEISPSNLPGRIRQEPNFSGGEEGVDVPFEEAERVFETDLILRALRRSNYVQTKAAELLGISRRILKYKMDKLGITDTTGESS